MKGQQSRMYIDNRISGDQNVLMWLVNNLNCDDDWSIIEDVMRLVNKWRSEWRDVVGQ